MGLDHSLRKPSAPILRGGKRQGRLEFRVDEPRAGPGSGSNDVQFHLNGLIAEAKAVLHEMNDSKGTGKGEGLSEDEAIAALTDHIVEFLSNPLRPCLPYGFIP